MSEGGLRVHSHFLDHVDKHHVVSRIVIFLNTLVRYGKKIPTESFGFFSGYISLSSEEIVVGIISNFLAFPLVLFLVFLFKNSRPRKLRENRIVQALFPDEEEEEEDVENDETEDISRPPSSQSTARPDSAQSSSLSTRLSRPQSAKSVVSAASVASTSSLASTSSTASNVSQMEAMGKDKFGLPWICSYVAWVLCILSIGASVFFIWAIGINLGNDKTYRWLTSLFVTLITSFFVLEPLKIVFIAIIYQIFCNSSLDSSVDNSDEDEEAFMLDPDEEWYADTKHRRTKVYRPYSKTYLEALKAARIKDVKNQAVASELFSYLVFLMILFLVSYDNRDPDSFRLKRHMERNVITKNKFHLVKTSDDFWRWAHSTLVSEIKAGPLYNGQPPYGLRGYLGDHTQRMMGFANLRQVILSPCFYLFYM